MSDLLGNAEALGSTVQEALTAGAAAIEAARAAADFLRAEGASDADKVEMALRHLNRFATGVSSPAEGSVYDDPAAAVTGYMPDDPTGTSGY